MKKNVVLIGGIVLLLFNTAYAERTIWYVHPDSTLNSIQAGLDSCADNDIVLVAPGTYVENITWPNTQGIHLLSELGPDTTIIDGDSSGIVITVATGVDTTTIINGFTIQNGYASNYGSGIYCSESSSMIMDNTIRENFGGGTVWSPGGGIECLNASPIITGNTITDNTANWGGGIGCYDASPLITNNTITGNTAYNNGGSIFCCHDSSTISDNTITGNTANYRGGGIYCHNASSFITNNTITENAAGFSGGGICCLNECSPTINGNAVADGGSIAYIFDPPIIRGNTITDNTADHGGGICCYFADPTITGNTITGNIASTGGGISCVASLPTITDNTITGNTANELGGGIYCFGSSPIIDSSTISSNNGDGVYCEFESSPVIHYCNITDNTGYGIRNVDSTFVVDATYNWWGDSTGPGGVGPGTGDEVSEYVDYEPWLFAPVGIEEETKSQKPEARLMVFPNPFSNRIDIRFQMEDVRWKTEDICLKIYDASGRLVKSFRLMPDALRPTQISWDGTNHANQTLPAGVYFLRFQAGDFKETRKLLVIK